MAYRLYWTEGAAMVWQDAFEGLLGAGYTTGGAGWTVATVDGDGAAKSNPANTGTPPPGYATLSRQVTLSRPGLLEFALRLDVPDRVGGLPGGGYLALLVDGIEAGRWTGSELWLPVRVALRPGTRTITWRLEDVDLSGAWAAIDDLRILECAPVPNVFHVTDYTPPLPMREAVVYQPLQGPPRVQAIDGGGTVAEMTVAVVGPDAYAQLISVLRRRVPLVWEDEGGRVYSGTAGTDLEVEQRGGLYLVRFQLVAHEAAGVGAA